MKVVNVGHAVGDIDAYQSEDEQCEQQASDDPRGREVSGLVRRESGSRR
jgi:hypothetical protein